MYTRTLTEKDKSKANAFLKSFELKVRPGTREEIYTLNEDASPELRDLVRDAHGNFLPDDFRYDKIVSALAALADGEEEGLLADSRHSALLKWFDSDLKRADYCDKAVEEFDLGLDDRMAILTYGQQLEIDEIVASVHKSLVG